MAIMTLLSRSGRVHRTAGLNWGSNNRNHTRRFDAYIPIHISTIRESIGRNEQLFFPKEEQQSAVTFTWDDGTVMQVLFEGNLPDVRTGATYAKQISSTPHKDTLGRYLRQRLGIEDDRRIRMEDLDNYGRRTVEITLTGPGQYNVDFSV